LITLSHNAQKWLSGAVAKLISLIRFQSSRATGRPHQTKFHLLIITRIKSVVVNLLLTSIIIMVHSSLPLKLETIVLQSQRLILVNANRVLLTITHPKIWTIDYIQVILSWSTSSHILSKTVKTWFIPTMRNTSSKSNNSKITTLLKVKTSINTKGQDRLPLKMIQRSKWKVIMAINKLNQTNILILNNRWKVKLTRNLIIQSD
jgi:hypothetical protein